MLTDDLIFDFDSLDDLTDGDEDIQRRALETFQKNLAQDIADLQQSHDDGNAEAYADMLHKLYGGCCYIGAIALAQACRRSETEFKDKGFDATKALHPDVLNQYQALKAFLSAHMAD